jgi:ADP-ribose pyrophosphatase YjhB (NUDIX family)
MTVIRHFTASAIVFDEQDRVLLVHHNQIGLWLYPGGHIEPNEDPAQAAHREVLEETGISTEVISGGMFVHPAVTTHATPYTIIEMNVTDTKVGQHRHVDFVYVLRAVAGSPTPQAVEVTGAQWVPVTEVASLSTPAELPLLISNALTWAKSRCQFSATTIS